MALVNLHDALFKKHLLLNGTIFLDTVDFSRLRVKALFYMPKFCRICGSASLRGPLLLGGCWQMALNFYPQIKRPTFMI